MELAFGPRHPAIHGVLRLGLRVDGERVVDCRPVIGHVHRGVEKLFELHSYADNLPLTDRLDFGGAAAANLAYAGAVEKLLGLEVPPRARYLRTVLAELQRIASHLLWLGTHAADIGALPPLFAALRERGRCFCLFLADHGEAHGEDGRFGHRIAHPSVTTVPYAHFFLD
jgi:NADH-quinone oxidoreductase subunit D